jgi:hypothetical protein
MVYIVVASVSLPSIRQLEISWTSILRHGHWNSNAYPTEIPAIVCGHFEISVLVSLPIDIGRAILTTEIPSPTRDHLEISGLVSPAIQTGTAVLAIEIPLRTCRRFEFGVLVQSGADTETAILAIEIQSKTCGGIESSEPISSGTEIEGSLLAAEISYTCCLLQIITRSPQQGRFWPCQGNQAQRSPGRSPRLGPPPH